MENKNIPHYPLIVIIIALLALSGSIYMSAIANFKMSEISGYIGSGLVSLIVIISMFNTIRENEKHENEQ